MKKTFIFDPQKLLDDMVTFVAVLDITGTVLFVNNTPLIAAGITLEEVKGTKFWDAAWWKYSQDAVNAIREDVEFCAKGNSLLHEIQLATADGTLIWIEYSMHPVLDEQGNVEFLVPEGRDITEKKEQQRLLEISEEKAHIAAKSEVEFLANMSHEIRTPMTGILGFLEQLVKTEDNPEKLKKLSVIENSGKQLLHIINDILDFSKIESGKMEIEYHPYDTRNIIEDTVDIFSQLTTKKNINLVMIMDENLPKMF